MVLLTIEEVADILRVPKQRAYQMARQELFPVVHMGRQIRVEESALRSWIANGGRKLSGGWRRKAEAEVAAAR